jgi:GR25 family glycosyltransferase involved in LPS biosynthesis
MQKIRVVVITVPNSLRSEPLLSKLKQSNLLEVEIFSAIMFSRSMSEYSPNYSKQKLVYGRELSDGEIGSAISHFKILSKNQDREQLLVVLEDDARIDNIKLFEEVILNFASFSVNTCAVLTLLSWT